MVKKYLHHYTYLLSIEGIYPHFQKLPQTTFLYYLWFLFYITYGLRTCYAIHVGIHLDLGSFVSQDFSVWPLLDTSFYT